MKQRTSLEALVLARCPRCREGKIFSHPATNLRHFSAMNPVCPYCGVRLEPEPGFYQGAMYVSYAFSVAILVAVAAILYVFGNPSEWVYIGTIVAVSFLVVPWNYRYSRVVYLYLFGGLKYKGK